MSVMKCLRCGGEMKYYQSIPLPTRERDMMNFPENIEAELYFCPLCGKMEFFSPEKGYSSSLGFSHPGQMQKLCGHCHQRYDADYPKCPWCARECEE